MGQDAGRPAGKPTNCLRKALWAGRGGSLLPYLTRSQNPTLRWSGLSLWATHRRRRQTAVPERRAARG
eukprot:5774593-Heterocapsa_arctica.AAC.1